MLKITPKDYDALRSHGEETYPHECCGVLLGRMDDDGARIVTSTARCGRRWRIRRTAYIAESEVQDILRCEDLFFAVYLKTDVLRRAADESSLHDLPGLQFKRVTERDPCRRDA